MKDNHDPFLQTVRALLAGNCSAERFMLAISLLIVYMLYRVIVVCIRFLFKGLSGVL